MGSSLTSLLLWILGGVFVLLGASLLYHTKYAHAPSMHALSLEKQGNFPVNPTKTWGFEDLAGLNVATDKRVIHNNEAQVYTSRPQNVRVKDGMLLLTARREAYQGKRYTSGLVDSKGQFAAEYGKFEAVIKVPKGKGTWPAFWLLSDNQPHTSPLKPTAADWAAPRFYMKDGELDIMEHYGHTPKTIEATVHTYRRSAEKQIVVSDATSSFHTYALEITPTQLVWTIDGKPYHTYAKPSDNPDDWPIGNGNKYYFILNLAMGGTGGGVIADSPSQTWQMQVDHVSYYPYIGARP